MPLDQGTRASKVTLLCVPTGFNQRLKAEELSHPVLSAPMSANGILADMVAEKVASYLALVGMQGVREARFMRFEPQTNLPQPPFRLFLQGHERVEVSMENQGVIRISHNRRQPVAAILPPWNVTTQCLFKTMKRHIGQQRGRGSPLWCPRPGGGEDSALHDPGFEPTLDESSQSRKRVELGEQIGVIDPIEALF
jgi:hypothetical protein